MKIALLTRAYSGTVEHLSHITERNDLTIVDFSKDSTLSNACMKMRIKHIPFTSWEQLEKELQMVDLLISYKLNKIIPMNIVNKFRFGGVNIHPSLLPKYPGPNPWFRMYYNMDLKAGVTIHKITEIPDSGNIIAWESFCIEPGMPLPIAQKIADDIASRLITCVINNHLFLNSGKKQETIDHSLDDTIELELIKQFPVERLCHLLRGFPSLIYTLYPELPHRYFEVGEYIRQKGYKSETDIINRDDTWWIVCNDGIISLCDFS